MSANLENLARPQDWKRSVVIPIPNKGDAKEKALDFVKFFIHIY